MVIGLNGRIPLNTAGNLASGRNSHAQHLGTSVSEIDPSYGLQNAFVPFNGNGPLGDVDPFNQMLNGTAPGLGGVWNGPYGNNFTQNTQVDNAIDASPTSMTLGFYEPVDVRLTQLRNLLAGTRPQLNPIPIPPSAANLNNDNNVVFGSFGGTSGMYYFMPNGIADNGTTTINMATVIENSVMGPTGSPLVSRPTPPVGGRWGEASSVPGIGFQVE